MRATLTQQPKDERESRTSAIEEQELLDRLKQRDSAAFRKLVELHKDRVYNTCLGFLRNPEDAEDVSQEVFIQVFKSVDEFREDASLETWIYRIAVTKSLELIRYRKRKKRWSFFKALSGGNTEPDEVPDEDSFEHPGLALEQKQRAAILYKEIENLTEKQRVAFTLHKVEGLSYKEVAGVMKLSVPAVESLMHRAKESLKQSLYTYYQQNELD